MAKQKGKYRLTGKSGGESHYKHRSHGYITRVIVSVPQEERVKSAAFAPVINNNTDFGYGSRVGKLIRYGVRPGFPDGEEGTTNTKLAGLIKDALKADTLNPKGNRRLTSENVGMLKGFNWTERLSLNKVLLVGYSLKLDGNGGRATLDIPSFVPNMHVRPGEGASYLEISLVLVDVDYDDDDQTNAFAKSELINLAGDEAVSVHLECSLDEFVGKLVVAGVGVQGYQEVNGRLHAMQDRIVFEIGGVWAG